jgi:hypothetical protein
MSQTIEITELLHLRNGTCHRCGWDGPVGRLPRQADGPRSSARKFGRLCAECASDLIQPEEPTVLPEQAPLVRTRSA